MRTFSLSLHLKRDGEITDWFTYLTDGTFAQCNNFPPSANLQRATLTAFHYTESNQESGGAAILVFCSGTSNCYKFSLSSGLWQICTWSTMQLALPPQLLMDGNPISYATDNIADQNECFGLVDSLDTTINGLPLMKIPYAIEVLYSSLIWPMWEQNINCFLHCWKPIDGVFCTSVLTKARRESWVSKSDLYFR